MYKLKKPEKIPVETLLGDIEMMGRKAPNLVTYSSEAPGTGYIVDTEEGDVLIVSSANERAATTTARNIRGLEFCR